METTYALNENETLQEIKRPPRIGFIKTFAGATPPEGTLLCDGSAVSRDTYSELFAAIGTTWGSGDGSTTFNLPDLRDTWILCAGTEHEAGESVAEGLPNITGTVFWRGVRNTASWNRPMGLFRSDGDGGNATWDGQYNADGAFFGVEGTESRYDASINANQYNLQYTPDVLNFSAGRVNAVYGASSHVTPASVAVLPCIVYE